jgi:hypothetical protein
VRKSHPTASFFNFFSPPTMPSDEAIEAQEVDPEVGVFSFLFLGLVWLGVFF